MASEKNTSLTEKQKKIMEITNGKLWEKHGHRHIYFSQETVLKLILDEDGDIAFLWKKPSELSNAKRRDLEAACQKMYLELDDDEIYFHAYSRRATEYAEKIIEILLEKFANL